MAARASQKAKLSKKSVNYRHTSSKTRNCVHCVHDLYKKGDKNAYCAIVAGIIEHDDVCDKFKKK